MGRRSSSVTVSVVLLLVALSPPATAEHMPPPTLDDLLGAECAAVGRFVEKDGAVQFVAAQVLWGDAGVVDELVQKKDFRVRKEADGGLTARVWGGRVMSMSGFSTEDATRHAIWFFFKDGGGIAAEPKELTSGFVALRGGNKPSTIYRLLQRLDYDMWRDALEQLFAKRDADVLAVLHRVALDPESLAAADAVDVLIQTRLLAADRFWGRWIGHPASHALQDVLQQRNSGRVARELSEAAASEKRPAQLRSLIWQAREDVDLNIRHLGHAAEGVRRRALGNLHDRLWQLARQSGKTAQAEALTQRLLPLLEERREVETSAGVRLTLDKMLKEQDGVPWILRVPATVEPPPPYSEEEERKFVLSRLTSTGQHGFVMESAGREIKEYFFAQGFEQLKAAAVSRSFNSDMVYEGMGYVRHPHVFAHLVKRAKTVGVGDDTFPATLRAIGTQNHERSFDVLKELIENRITVPGGFAARGACDALGELRDPRALTLLKQLEDVLSKDHAPPYLHARMAHGDPWALKGLLAALREAESPDSADVINALLLADAPEATEALKRHVRNAWPTRWVSFDGDDLWWCMGMQNFAGDSRRTTALGEVARRDPRWLADLALRKMESPSVSARICGAYVFRGLTARSFDFRPEAFASERTAPVKALQGWWAKHRTETREGWLLSHFRAKGFRMTRLRDKSSLPVLVQAMAADSFTHGLAAEQISVITGKYFGNYAQPTLQCGGSTIRIDGGGHDQKRSTIRVTGWLAARND